MQILLTRHSNPTRRLRVRPWLGGGRVDNSSRSARTPFGLPLRGGVFGNEIKTRSPGLRERIKRVAARYDCDRISDLFVEFCDSWP